MKQGNLLGLLIGLLLTTAGSVAQTYAPVPITGFNVDGIAESGTNAAAVTNTDLDLSTNLLYSAAFAAANTSLGATGLPNSGTLVNGSRTYQLQPYTGNNIFYLSAGAAQPNTLSAGTISLTTPARYSNISLLMFSTEGNSVVDVILNFTDGTSLGIGTFTLLDWFDGAGSVFSGFGRTKRLTAGPYTPDGPPTNNPRMYPVDIAFSCAYKQKLLSTITLTYMSGSTAASRLCVMALSGAAYTPLAVTGTPANATCGKANGNIALSTTGSATPYTYAWNTSPVQTTATASNLTAGTYTCTVTGSDNCSTTYTATITSSPVATITATAASPAICEGESTNISVTASGGTAGGYTWSPGSLTGATITVTPASTTTYTVSGTDNNGCSVTASVPVTVKQMPTSIFTVSPANVCLGTSQTITYTGNAPATATYNWFGFAGATVQSGSGQGPYSILFNSAGNYALQLQVSNNGCTSTITTQKDTVSTPARASFNVSDSIVCAGTTITVTFTGTAGSTAVPTWNWGGGAVQTGTGFGPYTVTYNKTGFLGLKINDGACAATANSKLIKVIQLPDAAFTADATAGCIPFNVTFNNQSTNTDSWKWTFGDGGASTDMSPVHTYDAAGTYTVTLMVAAQNKCFDTLVKTNYIQVKAMPVAGFTNTPAENVPTELHAAYFSFTNTSQNASSYTWHFGDNSTSSDVNPQHHFSYPGNYTVVLEAKNDIGCVDTAMRQFFMIIPDKVLDIPNAFSPNSDGVNDKWEIAGLRGNTDCEVLIFNRWGQQVFSSHGYENPWDGTWKGQPVPVATYYYVIKTSLRNYNGWLQLLR